MVGACHLDGRNKMETIDKLAWVCVRNHKLLVARSYGKHTYYIPGGKRDCNENDQMALIREIKEELSVDLLSETIEYIETFKAQAHDKPNGVMVNITCYTADFHGEIQADNEIEEVRFISYEDRDECSLITQIIMDWLKSKNMIE